MTTNLDALLTPLESTDPFLLRAMKAMAELLEGSDATAQLAGVRVFLPDYASASAEVCSGRYFTANCAALFDERVILLNEAYLLETEAAMRSFELAGDLLALPYLRSDEDLFGLAQRTRENPRRYVERLRAINDLPGREGAEAEAVNRFAMLLAFLVGHELGHLAQGHYRGAFGSFVDPDKPPESWIDNAVVRLTRHARELARLGFDLAGFEQVVDENSEIAADEKRRRASLEEKFLNDERWFVAESGADDFAIVLVQEIIERTAETDSTYADRLLLGVVDALFAAALYHWQRDLAAFLFKLGLPCLTDARELVLKMMESPQHYVHAAELFGDRHRFTMLRAILAIDAWLYARGVLTAPIDKPLLRREGAQPIPKFDPVAARQCWQREALLRIHIDTAVKIANVGALSGWMSDAERVRGSPQLFMMEFESIRQSVERLRRMQN